MWGGLRLFAVVDRCFRTTVNHCQQPSTSPHHAQSLDRNRKSLLKAGSRRSSQSHAGEGRADHRRRRGHGHQREVHRERRRGPDHHL